MVPSMMRTVGKIAVVFTILIFLLVLFFPHALPSETDISTTTYPEYKETGVVLAPSNSVIWNVSGPSRATSLIPFVVNKSAILSGSWISNNATAITVEPFTANKTVIQGYISTISNNSSSYSTSGILNVHLKLGKYYLIIGPTSDTNVRVMTTTTIQAIYY